MVSGFTVSETGKPEKPGKNRKQKLHLTDVSPERSCYTMRLTWRRTLILPTTYSVVRAAGQLLTKKNHSLQCYNSFFCPTIRRYVGLPSFLYPPSFHRASVLLRSYLSNAIPSGYLLSCTICIWRYDMISHVRYASTSHPYDY